MTLSKPWLLALAVALVPACTSDDGEHLRMEVAAHREACVGLDNQLCTSTRLEGETEFTYDYDGIVGFTPTWGRTYELEITRHDIPDPPEDGSSIELRLVRVIKEQPVAPGTAFDWLVPGCADCTPHLTLSSPTDGTLMDGTPFRCVDEAVCSQLSARIGGAANYTISFSFGDRDPLPLRVTAVADAD